MLTSVKFGWWVFECLLHYCLYFMYTQIFFNLQKTGWRKKEKNHRVLVDIIYYNFIAYFTYKSHDFNNLSYM